MGVASDKVRHEDYPISKIRSHTNKIRSSHSTGRFGAGVEDSVQRSAPNVAPKSLIHVPTHMPTCSLIRDEILCGWAPALQENVSRNIGAGYGTAGKYTISAVAAVSWAERVS